MFTPSYVFVIEYSLTHAYTYTYTHILILTRVYLYLHAYTYTYTCTLILTRIYFFYELNCAAVSEQVSIAITLKLVWPSILSVGFRFQLPDYPTAVPIQVMVWC